MRLLSISSVLNLSVLLSIVSNVYSELDILKKVFDKSVLKEIAEHLDRTDQFDVTQCARDIGIWYSTLLNGTHLWPFQMADSWGKFPPGILTLNIHSYGQFDECVRIEYSEIKGKYCLGKILLYGQDETRFIMDGKRKIIAETDEHQNRMMNFDDYGRLYFVNAMCFPHSCIASEIQEYVNIVLQNNGINLNNSLLKIPEEECTTKDPLEWTPTDWGALSFFIFFGVLVFLSTIYDLVIINLEKEPTRFHYLLISFSIWTNTSKLTTVSKKSSNLRCLHGLRALSILWIILGHRYTADSIIPVMNYIDFYNWMEYTGSMIILSGTFAVDTFFVLSGLLVAYTTFNLVKIRKSFHIPLFYLHRFVRLTPALGAVIFFQVSLYKFLGTGPLWNKITEDLVSRCQKNWWTALLYVQNYVDPQNMCLPQTWFLSCDMHYFLLSPIVIFPFLKTKTLGWPSILFWIIVSEIGVFVLAYENEWTGAVAAFDGIENRDKYFYFASHARVTSWLIGFAAGYFLYETSEAKIKFKKAVVYTFWIICLGTFAAIIFGLKTMQYHNHEITHYQDTLYNTFSKFAWSISVVWIAISCANGAGGPINWILSWRIWEIVGKLSYAMYLLHPSVIYVFSATVRTPLYFSNFATVHTFFSDVFLTALVSYLLVISFEMPFVNLERLLYRKSVPSTKSNQRALSDIEKTVFQNPSKDFTQ